MTYQLKGGEEIRDVKLYGWTGAACSVCKGLGEREDFAGPYRCNKCGGTGDEWGLMPEQPKNLHRDICPECHAELISASGGGVKCPACSYWFCY